MGLIVRQSEPLHDRSYALGLKSPHQFVFKRNEEPGLAEVSLTSGAAPELVVDSPGIVAFGPDDVEAANIRYALAELDVGSPARHVGGYRYAAGFARERDYAGFLLVVLGVEDLMLEA